MPPPPLPEETIPGISRAVQEVNRRVREYADAPGPLFLSGEKGTEKSMVAKLLHHLSNRSREPIGRLRVSWKMPPEMRQHVEHARKGTLVLQLQRELPIDLQYALVEYATSGVFEDPFSGESVACEQMMLVLMTSARFEELAASRTSPVLPELRDILSERQIVVPPLRERREDVPALVRFAMNRARETRKTAAQNADAQVLALFRQHDWPNNAEELLLVTAQAAMAAQGTSVTLEDLPEEFITQVSRDDLDAARKVRVPQPARRPARRPAATRLREDFNEKTPLAIRDVIEDMPQEPVRPVDYENEPTRLFHLERTPHPVAHASEEVTPHPVEPLDTSGHTTDEVPMISAAEVDEETAPPIAAPPSLPAAAQAGAQLPRRLMILAKRLNAQSQLLSTQMASPLSGNLKSNDAPQKAMEIPADETVPAEVIEEQLQQGLDMVFALRRQLAILNKRQRDSVTTFKDLMQRINMVAGGSRDERAELLEARTELAEQLDSINEIIDRVSREVPKMSARLDMAMGDDE